MLFDRTCLNVAAVWNCYSAIFTQILREEEEVRKDSDLSGKKCESSIKEVTTEIPSKQKIHSSFLSKFHKRKEKHLKWHI